MSVYSWPTNFPCRYSLSESSGAILSCPVFVGQYEASTRPSKKRGTPTLILNTLMQQTSEETKERKNDLTNQLSILVNQAIVTEENAPSNFLCVSLPPFSFWVYSSSLRPLARFFSLLWGCFPAQMSHEHGLELCFVCLLSSRMRCDPTYLPTHLFSLLPQNVRTTLSAATAEEHGQTFMD